MPPQHTGSLTPDQAFDDAERLYHRVPPDRPGPNGEIVPSDIRCEYKKELKKCPSVVRSRYATPEDALHSDCAGGHDVSKFLLFYLVAGDLPKGVEAGSGQLYDFYPRHDPEPTCYAHTLIACKKRESAQGEYDPPSTHVRNKLKSHFVAAFEKNRIEIEAEPLINAAQDNSPIDKRTGTSTTTQSDL
jgi:hypothetical protein